MSTVPFVPGLAGRRVHLAGSSSAKTDPQLTGYAHAFVARVTRGILAAGGGLVLGAGKEPRPDGTPADGPSLVFDWTALETVAECLRSGTCTWPREAGLPLVIVTSEKGESEIPDKRRALWQYLLGSGAVQLESIRAGARSGALLRERQAQFGDILLALGGGTGVEHLADLYIGGRHAVIPLDLPLGASRDDGTGGAMRLAREARAEPHRFFTLSAPLVGSENTRLAGLAMRAGTADVQEVADNAVWLVTALARPRAFYVRLLNQAHEAFDRVEAFFRRVVDPVIAAAGFDRIEMGTDPAEHAFINVSIFESLHFASVVVVDITGVRPNCFIELGYALGRPLRVIVTAEEGTVLPFDQGAIPCHFWNKHVFDTKRQEDLATFWRKNVDRPPIVQRV